MRQVPTNPSRPTRLTLAPYTLAGLTALAALASGGCSPVDPDLPLALSGATVFEGARLIVGDGNDPIENATFVVDDGRFVMVGNSDAVSAPGAAARVDLTGRTVIPALIDTHTHLSRTRDALIEELQRKAYYGVGVAMSLGQDDGDVPYQVRDEIIPDAARYRTAGRGITMPEPGRSEIPYWLTTPEEGVAAVQELGALNVDLVKIWVDDRNERYEKLSPALYMPIIEEAHRQGLRVTAHVFTLEDAKGLLRAGVDAFAHGVRDRDVDDELVDLFQERPHVVLVPNLPNPGVSEDLSWLRETIRGDELEGLQARYADDPAAQERFGIQARNLARLNAAGVRIGFGTDGNAGWTPHHELADMVAAGMTPHEVIVAATRTSAELLGLDDVGTVAPGKSADFVVLEANPLEEITNTRRIEAVYLRGALVDRAGLRSRWLGE